VEDPVDERPRRPNAERSTPPPMHPQPGRGDRQRPGEPRPRREDGLLRGRDARILRESLGRGDGPTYRMPTAPPRRPPQRRPVSAPPPPPPPGRRATRIAKAVLVVASVLVLVLTGYAWATFNQLTDNLATTPVIGLSAADGATDILLVGSDSRVDAQGNPLSPQVLRELRAGANEGELTDTLILVRIPNDGRRAVGISIPRDTFVDIPGGYGQHKINSAYGRAKTAKAAEQRADGVKDAAQVERESVLAGRKTLIKTIESLTGAGIDHYAEVNLLGFYEITKAVGGVDVCLNRATRDPDSGANFKAGRQTISGADALAFVRQRKNLPRGDLDRIVRQQVFMSGVADKMLSAGTLANPGKVRALITSIQKSIVLDDKLDPLAFAQQIRGIAAGQVQFVTIPVKDIAAHTADGDSVTVDRKAVRQFVADQTSGGTEQAPTANTQNVDITVDVRNASGVSGLAGRVLEELANRGYTRGEAANAAARKTSVVRYPSGQQALGAKVAHDLGGLPTELDASLDAGRVRVFVGQDYAGPGAQRFAPGPLVHLDGPALKSQPTDNPPVTAGDLRCVD
jgi:LCP family protein required for cell wall assembly